MKKKVFNQKCNNLVDQQIKKLKLQIKKLKNAIHQLETENFQLKNLIDNLPGDIYWKDSKGLWSGVNKRGAHSLLQIGFIRDRSDVIGKSDYQLFSKETADEYRRNDLEVMHSKSEITREEVNLLPNGEKIIQLSSKRPLWDKDGNVVGVVGNTIDISYLKRIEEELKLAIERSEAANQAKTEFLENMRHDIRTPLTGIIGFAELLKMSSDNANAQEYAENLVASSYALLDLLDEVLEAIRVSSGEVPKLKKKFNLENCLKKVVELHRACAAQKNLAFSFYIDPDIPKYVIGDKVRIHRVTLELIANALNFTDMGFVKLAAFLAKKDERKIVLRITIEDSGIGIPKDKQQEIYLQFKRLTPSYQGIYKGAGLGLSVVKQFIDEMGGEIYVESEVRKGTKFTCLIPLQEPLTDDDLGIDHELEKTIDIPFETTYAQQIKPLNHPHQTNYRVLIVEDNPIAQSVAQSLILQFGGTPTLAESGEGALAAWKTDHFDLIFMDIGLPDLDGYEITHQIRLQELVRKSHIPIIALTAHTGEENKKRCIEAGMNAVLTKPLTAKNCLNILNAFIPGYSLSVKPAPIIAMLSQEKFFLQLDSYPLLNSEAGIKATGSQETLIEMLCFMKKESLPTDVQLLKEAHLVPDWDKIQRLAHKIKGGAVYVGTTKLSMACQNFDQYCRSGSQQLLEALYQQLVAVIDDTLKEISNWLDTH